MFKKLPWAKKSVIDVSSIGHGMAKGRQDEAMKITRKDVADEPEGLPPRKMRSLGKNGAFELFVTSPPLKGELPAFRLRRKSSDFSPNTSANTFGFSTGLNLPRLRRGCWRPEVAALYSSVPASVVARSKFDFTGYMVEATDFYSRPRVSED